MECQSQNVDYLLLLFSSFASVELVHSSNGRSCKKETKEAYNVTPTDGLFELCFFLGGKTHFLKYMRFVNWNISNIKFCLCCLNMNAFLSRFQCGHNQIPEWSSQFQKEITSNLLFWGGGGGGGIEKPLGIWNLKYLAATGFHFAANSSLLLCVVFSRRICVVAAYFVSFCRVFHASLRCFLRVSVKEFW